MFCKSCGSVVNLIPGQKSVACGSCGEKQDHSLKLSESVKNKTKKIEVVDEADEVNINAKIKEECPSCKHDEAYFTTVQTRSSDEPETKFFKCVKCKKMWRDYS